MQTNNDPPCFFALFSLKKNDKLETSAQPLQQDTMKSSNNYIYLKKHKARSCKALEDLHWIPITTQNGEKEGTHRNGKRENPNPRKANSTCNASNTI